MRVFVIRVSPALLVYRQGGRVKCAEEGCCRMCERPSSVRRLTRHHLNPQRWFITRMHVLAGDEWTRMWRARDCDANIVPLCSPCHVLVETDALARRMLRKRLASVEVALFVKLRGQEAFDDLYPPSRHPAASSIALLKRVA